ncbi:hypothetical protein K435DRAFT_771803 [Dendrothele bispora CBS 962.96]|uniref:Uncharacterized protein n=1 Tax=Dendrothele bispora (strain CBS 962.96) TaxID=1314807 RepID=A0A4S8MZQ2_DENBC|nr:hypothetical protein K435DRAFT_771803 [Dendrothele bispora CBS 962.96]
MGRWTSEHYDQVLNTKIKSLVSGSIKRARLEKTEPTISYENFVEDLDEGDSFTSTIIDCLVKELADRRSRPSASDRRLIAERTAKNLRTLSSPFRIYWGRSRRPSTRRTEYITQAPHDIDLDDDEEIFVDNLTDGDTVTSDGPRADMYEPGSSSTAGYPLLRQASPIPVSGSDEALPISAYGPSSSSPWPRTSTTHLHNIGAVLSRHATTSVTRRPSRSRAVDFNDFSSFTSRRRTSIRDSLSSRLDPDPSTSHDRDPSRESIFIRPTTRRFFAPGAIPRRHRSEGEFNVWSDLTESEIEDRLPFLPSPPQWLAMDSPPPDNINNDVETSDERTAIVPRLRRGPRAPESILSRYASPTIVRASSDLFPNPPGLSASEAPTSAGGSPRLNADLVPEPVAYPTPTSAYDETSA